MFDYIFLSLYQGSNYYDQFSLKFERLKQNKRQPNGLKLISKCEPFNYLFVKVAEIFIKNTQFCDICKKKKFCDTFLSIFFCLVV